MSKIKRKYGIKEILFLLLVCFQLGHFGNTLAEYSVLLLMLIYFIIDLCKRKGRLKLDSFVTKYLFYMITFGIYAGCSYFWSENKSVFMDSFPAIIKCLFISFWLLYYSKDNTETIQFIKCFLIGVTYMCARIIAYLPSVGGFKYGLADAATRTAVGLPFNTAAHVAAFAIIIQCYFYVETRRIVYIGLMIPEMIVIYITGSRKAILLPVIGIVLIYALAFDYKKNISKLFRTLGIAFVMVFCIVIFVKKNETFQYRMLSLFESMFLDAGTDGSYMVRTYLGQKAIDMFKEKPIFGWGLNSFAYHGYDNMINVNTYGRYAHNNYLEIVSCLGIVGLVLYYIRYIKVILYSFKRRNIFGAKLCLTIFIVLALFEYGIVSYNTVPLQTILTLAFVLFHESIIDCKRYVDDAKK